MESNEESQPMICVNMTAEISIGNLLKFMYLSGLCVRWLHFFCLDDIVGMSILSSLAWFCKMGQVNPLFREY